MPSLSDTARNDRAGYIYVLSNPSMPGIFKVGHSKHGGTKRAADIYRGATGIPTPFELVFETYSYDRFASEAFVHGALSRYRVSEAREFFKCDEHEAIEAILNSALDQLDMVSTPSEYLIDESWMDDVAKQTGCHPVHAIEAVSFIAPHEMREYLRRYFTSREAMKQ